MTAPSNAQSRDTLQNTGVQIGTATRSEAPAILRLQHVAYESEARLYQDWSIPPLHETLEQLEQAFAASVILAARLNGELVGAVRGKQSQERCAVGRLIVRPDLQGQGIGRALMQRLEAEFVAIRCFELFTGARSERNIRLYESLGYRPCRSQVVSDQLTLVWMEKWRA
jgi:ribosomal protein S18 acetylase RimI-like enzyme